MSPLRQNKITPALLRRYPLPAAGRGGKDERGSVVIAAGAPQVPGAAILAATAALRAGAGKLKIATAQQTISTVAVAMPEALVLPFEELQKNVEDADAVVLGPGMLDERQCLELLGAVLKRMQCPILLDAAAITALAQQPELLKQSSAQAVLTPHYGEMARLLHIDRKDIEESPAAYAMQAARDFGAVVALKAADTYVATPQGELYCNRAGTPGLATSGSGDTLAGIIGGLLARGLGATAATVWGVFLHARAGEELTRKIGIGFLARELPAEIPRLMRRLSGKNTNR
ncbi:MAG: NAD(P)H-hydrate dehydratase [Candidatus Baltobacteraceae bacterium]